MTTHDKDKIIAAAKEVGDLVTDWRLRESYEFDCYGLERFYAIAFEHGRQAEREACAKVCEGQTEGFAATSTWDEAAMSCAKAIRARSTK